MLSVLIVDDSFVMRRMVARSLLVSGVPAHETREAANGVEALSVVREVLIDIVLCDLHMPGMDGVEFVRRLGSDAHTADIPVVIVSSERSEGLLAELEDLGVRGFLRKPFQPAVLGELVRDVLGLKGAA
ncbi:MAG TPA: response regulator [Polyangiaceae bacterium]|nr:response regulator [Polyangiaceae bacterium]